MSDAPSQDVQRVTTGSPRLQIVNHVAQKPLLNEGNESYSGLMPRRLTAEDRRSVSFATNRLNSSGELLMCTNMPSAAAARFTSGSSAARLAAAKSFSTIRRGVPAGANSPIQEPIGSDGMRSSFIVGTPGKAGDR